MLRVDRDRALDAEPGPGIGREGGLGTDTDDDQDHVGRAGHGRAVGRGGLDVQPAGLAGWGLADGLDGGAGQDFDAAAGEFGVDQRAQVRVDGGQDLGELFHLGDR